jgi:hypothetical protein
VGLVGFHYTDILRESKWLKANCSGSSGRNRTGGRGAKQHSGGWTMQLWMNGMVSNCTTIAIGKTLRGEKVNRGKPEQIPLLSKAEVVYVSGVRSEGLNRVSTLRKLDQVPCGARTSPLRTIIQRNSQNVISVVEGPAFTQHCA